MNNIENLKQKIKKGQFPSEFPEFGGANLIITKDMNRNYHEGDTIIYTEHASALSWLVIELQKIYSNELNYLNKYDFYPQIGVLIKEKLVSQELIFETMLHILDEFEETWGTT